jgi:hypothetical protein
MSDYCDWCGNPARKVVNYESDGGTQQTIFGKTKQIIKLSHSYFCGDRCQREYENDLDARGYVVKGKWVGHVR